MINWSFNSFDEKTVKSLNDFLPDRVFDCHAHLYRLEDLHIPGINLFSEGPKEVRIDAWREHTGKQVGERRLKGGLFMTMPSRTADLRKANEFMVSCLKAESGARGLISVEIESQESEWSGYLANPQVFGFKTYRMVPPAGQAGFKRTLPEWVWQVSDQRGWVIMIHLAPAVKADDVSDLRAISEKCRQYPNTKVILSHLERRSHSLNPAAGLEALEGVNNVWFDTSTICEPTFLVEICKEFGPRKLVWGSDFPISEMRGKYVSMGNGKICLNSQSVNLDKISSVVNPTLIGLESIIAIKAAAEQIGLNQADLEDIFCDNMMRLLGLLKESGTLTQELYKHAKELIPAGTQLLSKRPEMMAPDQWPAYFREARGCEVWDLDGKHYYDMATNGIGACLLGFRDPDVTSAVMRRINLGSMCTLNPPEEVELAERLCEIHPWAEQARFTRTGGETGGVAIRIARATTDRSVIAICGYHGWQDWYLAANLGQDDALRGHLLPGLNPLGVPRELRDTAVTFRYNNREEFDNIVKKYGDRLAGVIMEPCRYQDPEAGFLEYVRDGAHKCGALLIFDEITIGWRLTYGGGHLKFGVNPDMAIFAKALGNGHPIGAVLGTKKAMAGAHTSFISSTYWTESVGPVAALATLKKMKEVNVSEHVRKIGAMVIDAWKRNAAEYGLPVVVEDGYPCLAHFKFDHPSANDLRTLYTQLMLKRGFLASGAIYPTWAHDERIVLLYDEAIGEVFEEIAEAIEAGDVTKKLTGPAAHTGFKRLL
jgi:glutamate-1-semialdehyde 2,1-aminomutase